MTAAPPRVSTDAILVVEGLTTAFPGRGGMVLAADNVSLELVKGRALGIVGESGSGKSVTCRSLIGLVPPPGQVIGGSVTYEGQDLLKLPARRLETVRAAEFGFVFQDAGTALNPVFTVGTQITELLRVRLGMSRDAARERACELLNRVGISSPRARLDAYPHELSGGMRQRVMIAIATATEPKVLIADEPTTGLDVTVQAQILELLTSLREEGGMAVILVSHDFGVIAQFCERILVMYAGHVVEEAATRALFASAAHPYTQDLLRSIPSMTPDRSQPAPTISGQPPDLAHLPTGCPYAPRCSHAIAKCAGVDMSLESRGADSFTACPVV